MPINDMAVAGWLDWRARLAGSCIMYGVWLGWLAAALLAGSAMWLCLAPAVACCCCCCAALVATAQPYLGSS
eukprot:COSAG01_NODE_5497_length_4224_cov_7.503273_3_plen_72_part_00